MIYDCTMFFNELDLLEIRLEEHNAFVDQFIIIESNQTHSGEDKGYILEKEYNRFSKFHDKIKYIKIDFQNKNKYNIISWNHSNNIKDHKEIWSNENFQRNYSLIVLQENNVQDEDIILSSDLDEIIDLQTINKAISLLDHHNVIKCKQKHYAYKLNLFCGNDTAGPKILKYYTFKTIDPSLLREFDIGFEINGGWHFSFLSEHADNVYIKFKSFSHSFTNTDVIDGEKGVAKLRQCLIKEKVHIDNTFPKFIIDNIVYYHKYIEN